MVDPISLRKRAKIFAEKWKDAGYEKGQTHIFYYEFFQIFGRRIVDVGRFEVSARRLGKKYGFIDMLWEGVLLIEQKSAGKSLDGAYTQATEYFDELPEYAKTSYILACDFQTWDLHDLERGEIHSFKLSELPDHIHLFGFIRRNEYVPPPADPVSIAASAKMAKLHDTLKAGRYDKKNMEYLLTRLTFCMFADYVGIFEYGDFRRYLQKDMLPGATEVGSKLVQLFEVLDTPENERQTNLGEDLRRFPYIDGSLFNESIRTPAFDVASRRLLMDAADEDWSKVSPAIFGALFQNIMGAEERRKTGSHYTPEENIMKVIRPLFLDDLEAEFEGIRGKAGKRRALEGFQAKLSGLTFFDPACGAGNFLIIAYRELRRLEMRIMGELFDGQTKINISRLSKIDVDQFYGIEKTKFSANIAQTAMWMMDHLMNVELGDRFGLAYARIPIRKAPNIVCADALETDWGDLLEPERCSYILGNPPFAGAKTMSAIQRSQVKRLSLSKHGGTLDYVCAWFITAAKYAAGRAIRIGFVSTNSTTQGEQVWQLWQAIGPHGMEITFAYKTFPWDSDTKGKAHVHVVIIGMCRKGEVKTKRLFDGSSVETPSSISPYLFGTGGKTIIVSSATSPRNGLPDMNIGSKPIDDGNYIFTAAEKAEFVKAEPAAEKYMKEYVGAHEHINGNPRHILALHDVEPREWKGMPKTKALVEKVKAFRESRSSVPTINLAKTPTRYHVDTLPENPYLLIPRVSSERRRYVPIGYMEPSTIPSDSTLIVEDAGLGLFGLLTSTMHMVWLRRIGGRLETRLRYSKGVVYNTFPVPDGPLEILEPCAQVVLDARDSHPGSTLADLYDGITMPLDLINAHHALDCKVDGMYRKEAFGSDEERFAFLLDIYGKNMEGSHAGRAE